MLDKILKIFGIVIIVVVVGFILYAALILYVLDSIGLLVGKKDFRAKNYGHIYEQRQTHSIRGSSRIDAPVSLLPACEDQQRSV